VTAWLTVTTDFHIALSQDFQYTYSGLGNLLQVIANKQDN
jgi:hypothetical protein